MKKFFLFFILNLFILTSYAHGFYIGAGLGHSQTNLSKSDITGATRVKGNVTALHALFGYEFNKYSAVELGYMGFDVAIRGAITNSIRTQAVLLDAVGQIPLGKYFVLGAKGGVYKADVENPKGIAYTNKKVRDHDGLTAGLFSQWNINQKFALRLGYDKLFINNNTLPLNNNLLSLNFVYRFSK